MPLVNARNNLGLFTTQHATYTNIASCYCGTTFTSGVKITVPNLHVVATMLCMEISIQTMIPFGSSGTCGTLRFSGKHDAGGAWNPIYATFDGVIPFNAAGITVWVDNTQTNDDVIYILGYTECATF